MGGSIELKSKVGVGTTVIVKIPFKIGTQDNNSNLSDKPVCLDDYSVEGQKRIDQYVTKQSGGLVIKNLLRSSVNNFLAGF